MGAELADLDPRDQQRTCWFYSNNQSYPLGLENTSFHSQGASCVFSSHFFSSRRIHCFSENL